MHAHARAHTCQGNACVFVSPRHAAHELSVPRLCISMTIVTHLCLVLHHSCCNCAAPGIGAVGAAPHVLCLCIAMTPQPS